MILYIAKKLNEKGFDTRIEPRIQTTNETICPDIIACKSGQAIVLDVQVVTDGVNLELTHSFKKHKYSSPEFKAAVGDNTRNQWASKTSIRLNCKGIRSKRAAEYLLNLGTIEKRDLAVLSTRVLIGTFINWKLFNEVTTTFGYRGRNRTATRRRWNPP